MLSKLRFALDGCLWGNGFEVGADGRHYRSVILARVGRFFGGLYCRSVMNRGWLELQGIDCGCDVDCDAPSRGVRCQIAF